MSAIRNDIVIAALNRSIALIDYNVHDDFHKQHEFKQQTILADKSLTKDEKTYAIRRLIKFMTDIKLNIMKEQEEFVKIVAKNV